MDTSTRGQSLSLLRAAFLSAALLGLAPACLAPACWAAAPATQPDQTVAATGSTPAPHGSATALLQRVNAAYAALTAGDFSGHIVAHFDVAGQKKDDDVAFAASFLAPNQFHHQAKGDVLIGCTGTKFYAFEPQRNVYTLSDAPAGRAQLSEWPQMMAAVLQGQNPSLLLALTSTSGAGGDGGLLAQLGQEMVLLPETVVGPTACPTLQFHPDGHGTITFVVDPHTSLLRQASFDLREMMTARGATDVKAADVTIVYADASPATRPAVAEAAGRQFAWTPPATAVLASAATAPAPSDDQNAAQGLVGKAAPDFSLPGLDDKTVKLSSLKGSVVVLDFWATWCGPCVESLPHLDDLYKDQSPHGLKVFAVNLQEDKDHVKAFVQKKGWSLPVLLDGDGSVGQKYSTDSIPETVIVGKDGNVKKVFVGVGPDTESDIKATVSREMGQ